MTQAALIIAFMAWTVICVMIQYRRAEMYRKQAEKWKDTAERWEKVSGEWERASVSWQKNYNELKQSVGSWR